MNPEPNAQEPTKQQTQAETDAYYSQMDIYALTDEVARLEAENAALKATNVELITDGNSVALAANLAKVSQENEALRKADALQREELIALRQEHKDVLALAATDTPDATDGMNGWAKRIVAERDALRKERDSWRNGGVTEEILRRQDGAIKVGKGCIIALASELTALRAEVGRLRDHLSWVLPMAKGYAAQHPVGRNAEIVAEAENALTAPAAPQAGRTGGLLAEMTEYYNEQEDRDAARAQNHETK